MNQFKKLLFIETKYDSFNKAELVHLEKISTSNELSQITRLYLYLWERKASQVYSLAKELLSQPVVVEQKVCILQAAIAMTEIEYDLKRRQEFLFYWNSIGSLASSFYAQHLYFYQKGMSYFYAGALQSALEQWEESLKLAIENRYARGEFRLKYHIGLIYKEKGYKGKALSYFAESYQQAKSEDATRFATRVQEQITSVEKGLRIFNMNQLKVIELLGQGLKVEARDLVLNVCRKRRYEQRSWDSQSEDLLLALIALAFKKMKTFNLIIHRITDDFILLSIFEIASQLNLTEISFDKEISFLRKALNISEINDLSLSVLQKVNLDSDEMSAFISLLEKTPDGLSKEEICKKLWDYNYDPVLHDNKIYKLIHKTRKSLGLKALITNSYGGKYRINKDWLENK